MNILLLAWENFGSEDMKDAFESLGHSVKTLETSQEDLLNGAVREAVREAMPTAGADAIFSFNYFPNVAEECKAQGIPYLAWVYDSPCVQLYSYTVIYPTNHIFVFDSDTYLKFAGQGISTIKYLPMAAYPERLCALGSRDSEFGKVLGSDPLSKSMDISFVGSLYHEKHQFFRRMQGVSEYTEGYLRGIMESQKHLYGCNLVESALSPEILEEMHRCLPLEPAKDSAATREWLFSEFVLNRQITAEERKDLLELVGRTHPIDLFTADTSAKLTGCRNHGPVDFYEGAPRVFGRSRINLNISLRSIVNGIPLRCFEIMGSGGFLLTNYQGDFGQFFTEGEDYVAFESPEDLCAKVDYYLTHEEERAAIAANGLAKIREAHTYVHRAKELLENLG